MIFSGAKLAVFIGSDLLVILRDDRPDIPFPGFWDFPGGGREGKETPVQCALRETREEVGLTLTPDHLIWQRRFTRPHGAVWFFVAHLPAAAAARVVLGDEGQCWRLMSVADYLGHEKAVPHFAVQLRTYLEENRRGIGNHKAPR